MQCVEEVCGRRVTCGEVCMVVRGVRGVIIVTV